MPEFADDVEEAMHYLEPYEAQERLMGLLDKLTKAAGERRDGHLTIFRWTTGWKAMLGTPDLDTGNGRDEVQRLPMFETLSEAAEWAASQK